MKRAFHPQGPWHLSELPLAKDPWDMVMWTKCRPGWMLHKLRSHDILPYRPARGTWSSPRGSQCSEGCPQ